MDTRDAIIETTPRASITSLIEGLRSKVVGRVRPRAESLVSPFFRRACVGYELVVRARTDDVDSVVQEHSVAEFAIEDDSGSILVHTGRIELDLCTVVMCARSNSMFSSGDLLLDDEREHLTAILDRHGSRSLLSKAESFTIAERYLQAHSQAAVSGVPLQGLAGPAAKQVVTHRHDPFRRLDPQSPKASRFQLELGPGRRSAVLLSDNPLTFD